MNPELLGGILVDKMVKQRPHTIAEGQCHEMVRIVLPPGRYVEIESAIRLGRFWRPETDLAVVRGHRRDYPRRHPGATDLALVVEIADTTYAKARGVRYRRYAAARIPAYWIADIPKKQIEAHGDPAGRGKTAAYGTVATYGAEDEVPVVLDGAEVGRIAAKTIFP